MVTVTGDNLFPVSSVEIVVFLMIVDVSKISYMQYSNMSQNYIKKFVISYRGVNLIREIHAKR